MKNKRGSHVGLVLSFVIFVVFLLFLYPFVDPALKNKEDKQYLLDSIEKRLIDQFKDEINTISMNLNQTVSAGTNCVETQTNTTEKLQDILGADFNESALLIKDKNSVIQAYNETSGGLRIEVDPSEPSSFFKIFYSSRLDNSPVSSQTDCVSILDNEEIFGAINIERQIFESKIIEMLGFYETGYEVFKSQLLKMSPGNEFGFSFTYSNGTEISTEEVDIYTSTYVSEVPILYLDSEANINKGSVKIKLW